MSYPRCASLIVTKDGTTQFGGQRFRWSQFGRRFTRRSSSTFSGRGSPDDIIALAGPGSGTRFPSCEWLSAERAFALASTHLAEPARGLVSHRHRQSAITLPP